MNPIKRLYLSACDQLLARKNLYLLRDRRALNPVLPAKLLHPALKWFEMLPSGWKPRTVIDVGANRGSVADEISELYAPDFMGLVEPLPEMHPILESGHYAREQRLFACGAGSEKGEAELHVIRGLVASSFLTPTEEMDRKYDMREIARVKVPVETLDNIYGQCGLDSLDLLIVDVQGHELAVFTGGRECLGNTRVLVTEVSFVQQYVGQPLFRDIYDFLSSAEFELRGTFGFVYSEGGLPEQCDAVFINRKRPVGRPAKHA